MKNWRLRFQRFFAKMDEHLSRVLPAVGCREGWLQGEVYRYLRSKGIAAYTNYALPVKHGKSKKRADIAVFQNDSPNGQLEFVAELKVYGETGYCPKNLTGGSLSTARRIRTAADNSLTFSNCKEDRRMAVGWGLLSDYFRLVDFVAENVPLERRLILCVKKDPKPDEFGKLLRQVEFERPGVVLHDAPGFWVKSWVVGQ